MHVKLMTSHHHLHLNLTRQGHVMPNKLEHAILACVMHPITYLCAFLTGILTLAPDTAEETFVEFPYTETEDPVGSATTTDPGKGDKLCHYFITFCSCLAVV